MTSVDNGSIENKNQPTVDEVQEWLISYLSQLLDLEIEEISTSTSFNRYGLDSSASISLTSDFGDWLSKEIDPTILYSYPTIEAMAEHFGA
ncbi:phosphopantetheine-binding protein [Moorena producens 3L]|nr:phosphopantetheine-binding protein [Moorena producens 3L]